MALVFSIAVPVRGHAAWLPWALTSLAAQTPRVQLAVLDASPDDAVQRVLADHGVVPDYGYHRADAGQAAAIQDGWTHTSGDVVAWLCADDFYYPDTLARVAEVFDRRPDVDVVFGHGVHLTADGAFEMYFPATDADAAAVRRGCTVCQPACFVRRGAMERVGGLETEWHYVMDWAFWLRLHEAGCLFHFLDAPLAAVRVHADTKTRSGGVTRRREVARLLDAHKVSPATRLRARLAFWKADALAAPRGTASRAAAMGLDLAAVAGRRVGGRPRPTVRGLEAWTNRVERECVVELPWFGPAPPSRVSVLVDTAAPLTLAWDGGSAPLQHRGPGTGERRGRRVAGREADAAIAGPRGGRVAFTLRSAAGPWHLWRLQVE